MKDRIVAILTNKPIFEANAKKITIVPIARIKIQDRYVFLY